MHNLSQAERFAFRVQPAPQNAGVESETAVAVGLKMEANLPRGLLCQATPIRAGPSGFRLALAGAGVGKEVVGAKGFG